MPKHVSVLNTSGVITGTRALRLSASGDALHASMESATPILRSTAHRARGRGGVLTLKQICFQENLEAQYAFKVSMIH